ncbi:MAG TPA: chlorite dismutase family protein [Gemmatimonadaceae bacterium]|nr:chlorite dismutase family protein [Gemmatimonadaceae bacterium]
MKKDDAKPLETKAPPPETIEGWYSLHQVFRRIPGAPAAKDEDAVLNIDLAGLQSGEGWSIRVDLIGSTADFMLIHFRETLDEIAMVRDVIGALFAEMPVELVYNFLSVTEAGLYHATAELAALAIERGGEVGDELYSAAMAKRVKSERASEHVKRRLYPPLPAGMPYVCFYPMSKRRAAGQNWYALPLDERSRLMQSHGLTGRRYAGRVQQIITGAIGFEPWEWGITLFAKDPLDFKKLVTDMRFDEVSAQYAEFGEFFVGKIASREVPLFGQPADTGESQDSAEPPKS